MTDKVVAFIFYIPMGYFNKLASAIYNDVVSGLRGLNSPPTMFLDQLEDDIVDERLQIIKEYSLKGLVPKKDLLLSINCINTDCKPIESSNCRASITETPTLHFEIPQIMTEFASDGIEYIGSIDKKQPFTCYLSLSLLNIHKYRRRAKNKPYVFIDVTPNENNMCDCFVFNAPLLKQVSVVGVFKDPRQLEYFGCCHDLDINNMTFMDAEIKKRLTEKKIRYYRQMAAPIVPNDQVPR